MAFTWKRYFALVSIVLMAALAFNSAAFADESTENPGDLKETLCQIEIADQAASVVTQYRVDRTRRTLQQARARLVPADLAKLAALARGLASEDLEVAGHSRRRLNQFGFDFQKPFNVRPDGSEIPADHVDHQSISFGVRDGQLEISVSGRTQDRVVFLVSSHLQSEDDHTSLQVLLGDSSSMGLQSLEQHIIQRLPDFCLPQQPADPDQPGDDASVTPADSSETPSEGSDSSGTEDTPGTSGTPAL